MSLKESEPPRLVGGNIAINIDEDEYSKGLLEFVHNLIGRIVFAKGDTPLKNDDLKQKLSGIWKIREDSWRLTPLGRGFFNIHLPSHIKKSKIFAMGAIFLKPGIFKVSEWKQNFNPFHQNQTNAQVWVRFYELPLEYWRASIYDPLVRV